jgi:hypothetical protein
MIAKPRECKDLFARRMALPISDPSIGDRLLGHVLIQVKTNMLDPGKFAVLCYSDPIIDVSLL